MKLSSQASPSEWLVWITRSSLQRSIPRSSMLDPGRGKFSWCTAGSVVELVASCGIPWSTPLLGSAKNGDVDPGNPQDRTGRPHCPEDPGQGLRPHSRRQSLICGRRGAELLEPDQLRRSRQCRTAYSKPASQSGVQCPVPVIWRAIGFEEVSCNG